MVHIDFASIVTSKTQPQAKLMHPSVPTCLNEKRFIYTLKDLNELIEEFTSKNLHSEIILHHNSIRTPGDNILSSNLKVEAIVTLFMYIFLLDFE